MDRTRNAAYGRLYPGFESQSLRYGKQNRDVVLLFVLHLFYRLSCVAQSKPVYLHRVTNNNLNTIYHETLICSAPFKHVLDRASPSATLSESRVEC